MTRAFNFTHVPASHPTRCRGKHHVWTDVVLPTTMLYRNEVRASYRTMRKAGISPREARHILWSVAMTAMDGGRGIDHDVLMS